MGSGNSTMVTEFILLGFISSPELQALLFALFLVSYVTVLLGNAGLLLVIYLDARLHTPMYLFLRHLSFVDLCYSSAIVPKALNSFVTGDGTISFLGCAVQFCVFGGMLTTECCLLAVMAYDRFVAVCKPLLYTVTMSDGVCTGLLACSYASGFLNSLIQTLCTFSLPFCGANQVDHFFCDITPLVKLSCTETRSNETIILASACVIGVSSFLTTMISYLYIFMAILRIPSLQGRRKTFSTCTSHLTAVSIFFGTLIFMYLRPKPSYSAQQDKAVSVLYTLVIPMVNPMIYSLRNKEVKEALRRRLPVTVSDWHLPTLPSPKNPA
ncbi:olfactory receptor 1052-like [Malaclemys terrapin pileata]|uniref:olfactory receptor 1052-like n=1 Tax=Malaclemys terrapin pileata TaxID=2991368 RepID=UPI0023A88FC0|nr:olfactory receptor 1052-like [Malaclemys terrapin pileata]